VGCLGEIGDACDQDVTQRRRKIGSALVTGGDEELLGEERIAAGSSMDRFDQRRVEIATGDRPELVG
jgi:hypothetical protein